MKRKMVMNLANELEAIFWKYIECFGIPDETEIEDQCNFEEEFKIMICKYKGHKLYPDQCGIKSHDYCVVCGVRREEIDDGVLTDCHGDVTKTVDKPSSFISRDFRHRNA